MRVWGTLVLVFISLPTLKMKLRCLVVGLSLCVCALAGKYSREVNEPKAVDGDGRTVEFRIAKLNQVWEKAIRVSLQVEPVEGV